MGTIGAAAREIKDQPLIRSPQKILETPEVPVAAETPEPEEDPEPVEAVDSARDWVEVVEEELL